MKLPQSFFTPILFVSVLGHASVFVGGGFLSLSPQFGVQQAPSSMEVVISKVEPETSRQVPQDQLFTTLELSEKTVMVKKPEASREETPKVSKPVHMPSVHGASNQTKPAFLKNPAPRYPEYARMQGWEGVVSLRVVVKSDGAVGDVVVEQSSGYKVLDDSAVKTVRAWQFLPVRVGSATFSSQIKIPIRFSLT
jgi:protein TonB